MDERTRRAKSYWRHKHIVTLSGLALSIAVLAAIQASGASASLKAFALSISTNFYVSLLVYIAAFSIIVGLATFPLDLYGGFIVETKFKLSNQTFPAWLIDEVKGSAISFIFFAILIEALYAILNLFPGTWWLIAALFWIGLSLVLAKLFPLLIIPLFYKYKPLSRPELRGRALKLAAKFNIKVMDVFEIDFSTKTKKSNAAIVGWGAGRRIILADNLVNEFTDDETVAVLAHEMAHHRLKHIWILLSVSAASIVIFFYILQRAAAGLTDISLFPTLYIYFIVYGAVMMPLQNAISRWLERDADTMALRMTGSREAFISLMEKLGLKNLSDENPDRIIELVFYSHPPISKRIALARSIAL